MKKIFVVFALFAIFFAVSCGEVNIGDINVGSQSDTADTNTNQDISDSGSETEKPDGDTDTAMSNKQQGELDGECYPNKTCIIFSSFLRVRSQRNSVNIVRNYGIITLSLTASIESATEAISGINETFQETSLRIHK